MIRPLVEQMHGDEVKVERHYMALVMTKHSMRFGEVIPGGVDAYSAGTVGIGAVSGRGRGGSRSSIPLFAGGFREGLEFLLRGRTGTCGGQGLGASGWAVVLSCPSSCSSLLFPS